MYKTVIKVNGMSCPMCEAHVNDAVRNAVKVKKVTSSKDACETVVLTEEMPDVEKIVSAINATGYEAGDAKTTEYEKKGLFSFLKK